MNESELIHIDIKDKDSLAEIVDFIENELQPPSKVKWLILFFTMGLMAGIGLGVFIIWIR